MVTDVRTISLGLKRAFISTSVRYSNFGGNWGLELLII